MKKIFIYLFGLILAFTSCAKISEMNYEDYINNPQEVVFNVDNAVTKAGITTGTTLQENFKVYGYVKPTTSVTDGGFIMKDAEYQGTDDNKGKPVTGTYYWPKADNNSNINVRFVAYSPVGHSKTVTNNGTDGKPESVTFNVTANAINQTSCVDLLYAIADDQHPVYTEGSPNKQARDKNAKVALQFHHALAWLKFEGKRSSEVTSCEITSITFSEALNTTSDLTINLRDNSTTPTWGTKSGELNQFITSPVTVNDSYTALSDAVIIPQNAPINITVTFNVTIEQGDETINYTGRQVTRTINQGTDENGQDYISTFAASHKYTYRFFITADGIEFTISVDNWTDGSTNPFLIWDYETTAYVEHFFEKASTQKVLSLAIA